MSAFLATALLTGAARLGMRPTMAHPDPSPRQRDFHLLGALPQHRFRVADESFVPSDLSTGEIPVIEYGRERGVNVLHDLGITDVIVIGVLHPHPDDLVDRVRALLGASGPDQELRGMKGGIPRCTRTRLGRAHRWTGTHYEHPQVRHMYRHLAVAPIAQRLGPPVSSSAKRSREERREPGYRQSLEVPK